MSVHRDGKRKELSPGLTRVRELAERDSSKRFTSLLHHINVPLLEKAYQKLNPCAVAGVDDVTWHEYGQGLKERLEDLHGRIHRGGYRAKPSKRIYIPKGDGRQRPIGIAALEDKVVQQAVVWVLEAIYESTFLGFSYGFRPGRSQHDALDAIYMAIDRYRVNWILDADIEGFFDNLDHEVLMVLLEEKIGDKRLLRIIRKWLKAGVSEDGEWSATAVGTPQGAVISPMLANIYLHYVVDQWVHAWRKTEACGEVYIVRYADDIVMGFQKVGDARALKEALIARLAEHGLRLHPEKTRLIEFGRFAEQNRRSRGQGKPETFDFLGFTHICDRRRTDDGFYLLRKTKAKKTRRKVQELKQELRGRMHEPFHEIGTWLGRVVRGHYQYYGVPGNLSRLDGFRHTVMNLWYQVHNRRSQKRRGGLTLRQFKAWVAPYLPQPHLTHPYPRVRFSLV